MQINLFQETAESKISNALQLLNLRPTFAIKGEKEPYLFSDLSEVGLKIYVYLDGLEFDLNGVSAPFEHQEFESLDQLLEAFTNELLSRLRVSSPNPAGAGP